MDNRAVVLISGGLDSATVTAIAAGQGYALYGLSFSYGQRHDYELKCAAGIAADYNFVEHHIITIPDHIFRNTSLVASSRLDVPWDRDVEHVDDIPSTYVPARNALFLSYGLAFAESIGSSRIYIGVNALDYSGYPDCRPEFISAFENMANLATRAGVEGTHFTIEAPLLKMTKAEIISVGISLGVDYSRTHSCYRPAEGGLACGRCDSCLLRKKGFEAAGVVDPTRYENGN